VSPSSNTSPGEHVHGLLTVGVRVQREHRETAESVEPGDEDVAEVDPDASRVVRRGDVLYPARSASDASTESVSSSVETATTPARYPIARTVSASRGLRVMMGSETRRLVLAG